MLHIIAVMKRVAMDDGTVKNDIYYDIVRNAPDCEEEEVEICAEAEALYFMQMEEQDVNDRLLQIRVLGNFRNYDVKEHKNLTAAIARELSEQDNCAREERRRRLG
jgi:hypothetical protein